MARSGRASTSSTWALPAGKCSLTVRGIDDLEALGLLERGREDERHAAQVGLAPVRSITGVTATRIRARVIRAPSAGRGRGFRASGR